jgi:prolipoprotein diacylglyceryltransferase
LVWDNRRLTFPVYLGVGAWSIHPHWVFDALAYFIGFQLYLRMRRRRGDVLSGDARWWMIAAAIAGAAIGSKVLFWFEDPAETLAHWREPLFLLGGKTVVGALVGGLIAVEIAKRWLGITARTGDLFAVPLAVGIGVGRIGCFLSGLPDRTYGSPSTMPWAVDFGDGIPRHPTQLYETTFLWLLAAFLARTVARPHREGDVFRLFMVGYLAFRLVIDALKPEVRLALGLSAIQWTALAVVVHYRHDVARWLTK